MPYRHHDAAVEVKENFGAKSIPQSAGSRMRKDKMAFGDQIKRFGENLKQQMEAQKEQVEQNAKQRLVEILGDDAALIKNIALDADMGKFYDIDAPQEVVDRLRNAGMLKE